MITGSARRIGAKIAEHLHQAGFRVAIHCNQSQSEAELTRSRMNQQRANSATVVNADLSLMSSISVLIAEVVNWGGRLDALVNNASIFTRNPSDWDRVFNLNVKVPFFLSQEAYPYLREAGGAIINITDIHAERPLRDYAVYCQSKAALMMQTKALAQEFAPHVRVNAVAPGAIMWPEDDNQLDALLQQRIIEKTPLLRHGDPLFIAQAVLALIQNAFITGQTLNVDGGRSI